VNAHLASDGMMNANSHAESLSLAAKREILAAVLKALDTKFYKPVLLGDAWKQAVDEHRMRIETAPTHDAFEESVSDLLKTLGVSHLGFFHGTGRRASSRAALSATYLSGETDHGMRWIFQDVHEGGAAHSSGIEPGNILLRVSGKDIVPPHHPVFPMGSASTLEVIANDGETRIVSAVVARPNGKKLQFIEPTLVQARKLTLEIGYIKVAMFPGMIGVDVANEMTAAVEGLGNVKGLVVDLRGNTGGGAGALRLMSLLTPSRLPVGFSPDKWWAERHLAMEKTHFPRFNRIPEAKTFLWLLALKFLPSLMTRSPVLLETEGLGAKPFHGQVVLLVNRHTASAAEMVTVFAQENRLATVLGERTAGRLLSASSVKVGHGFRLALPTGAYYTWNLTVLEGTPLDPDIVESFDWESCRSEKKDLALEKAVAHLRS
jgi:carboxyl-terminal processing protease